MRPSVYFGATLDDPTLVRLRDILIDDVSNRLPYTSRDTFPLSVTPSERTQAIASSSLFVGIYPARIPSEREADWHFELYAAIDGLASDRVLLFRIYTGGKGASNWRGHPLLNHAENAGLPVFDFMPHDEERLRLHCLEAVAKKTSAQHTEEGSPVADSLLKRVFDFGADPPYYLVYGRRRSRDQGQSAAREEFGSLITFSSYDQIRYRLGLPPLNIAVEPLTSHVRMNRSHLVLLSGPPTSDISKEYFEKLRDLGIDIFSGSCKNHHGELCESRSNGCNWGRRREASGCAQLDGRPRQYSYKGKDPPIHLALLVYTPSPWAWGPTADPRTCPVVVYAAGCHSEGGVLARDCIEKEDIIRRILRCIGLDDNSEERPYFTAMVSREGDDEQDILVEHAAKISVNVGKWELERLRRPDLDRQLERLRNRYTSLRVPSVCRQRRGFELETIVKLTFETLDSYFSPSYRSGGTQTDGYFEVGPDRFLLECRWTGDLADAREITAFCARVDRTGAGAKGLFLGINGWTDGAIEELKKTPNKAVVLMNGDEFEAILRGEIKLGEMLTTKTRHLAKVGEPFLPVKGRGDLL